MTLASCSESTPPPRRGRPPEAVVDRTAWGLDLEAGETALRDGRFDRAEDHLLAAMRSLEQAGKKDATAVARVHRALGKLYGEHMRKDLAVPHLEAAIEIDTGARDADRRQLLDDRRTLAVVLDAAGDHAEEERRLRQVLGEAAAAFGPNSVEAARVQVSLADCLSRQHAYGEAEGLYRRALPSLDEQSQPVEAAEALAGLATVHYTQSALRDARAELERALGLRERYQSRQHPHVARVLYELTAIDLAEGRLPEAEKTCGRAVAILQRSLPTTHPLRAQATERMVDILRRRGKSQEAAKLEAELRR